MPQLQRVIAYDAMETKPRALSVNSNPSTDGQKIDCVVY